jgi:hypothetical protein
MIINKDLLDFSSVTENLYKYIVIIGLSLFFIPSINSTNIVNIMSKHSEIRKQINIIKNEIDQESERITAIENEITLNIEEINNNIDNNNNVIKNMNYFFPDGKQVLTIYDLEKFIETTKNLMDEIIDDIKKGININLIKNKLHILFTIFGNTDKDEEMLQNVNRIFQKLNDTNNIIENIDNFLLQKEDELNTIKLKIDSEENESNIISIEINNLLSELDRIEIEYRLYSTEKLIYDFSRIIGILLVIFGSVLWYFKIQRYVDNIYKG